MTIDETIKHYDEVAMQKEYEATDLEYSTLDWKYEANKCLECASEHRQLAEWLKELRVYRLMMNRLGEMLADNGYTEVDIDRICKEREAKADEDSD